MSGFGPQHPPPTPTPTPTPTHRSDSAMPPISMFDDDLDLETYHDAGGDDFLGLFPPHEADPKCLDSALLPPASAQLPTDLSPNASDQDSASDSSPSPNTMNNPDEDFDMFSNSNTHSGEWQFYDFTNFEDAPATDQTTINPSLINGGLTNGLMMDPSQSSSPSDSNSNSSNGLANESEESPPVEPVDAIMQTGWSKFLMNGTNGNHAIAKPPRPSASQSRKKRNSHQSSISRSANNLSVGGSREPSPMLFSQSSSPLPKHEKHVPEPHPVPQRHLPLNSWFGVSPGQNQWADTQMTVPAFQGAVPAYAPLVQNSPVAPPSPMTTLAILEMPKKSRVETQIHLKMSLHPVPQGITKIRLPRHTISKPKFLAKPKPDHRPDTLELSTQLVCSSAMSKPNVLQKALARAAASGSNPGLAAQLDDKAEDGGEVRICTGCITREQKRANRKKNNRPGEDDEWKNNETERVVVFNTSEIKELKAPEYNTNPGTMLIDIPMRIACYCRHHHEKVGFKIIFTLKNHTGQIVAQVFSPSIMITDDHKTPQTNPNSISGNDQAELTPAASPSDLNSIQPGLPFRQSQSTSDLQALQGQVQKRGAGDLAMPVPNTTASSVANSALTTPNISRPPSPGAIGPSAAKKRKASNCKVPNTLTMTRIETYTAPPRDHIGHVLSGPSSATSPFSPQSSVAFSDASPPTFSQAPPNMFPAGARTPNGAEQIMFQPDANRTPNSDPMAMYSAPASSQNSRAPSPNSVMNGVLQHQSLNLLPNTGPLNTPFANQNINGLRHPMPVILKVLPVDGPTSGGIEVSILGSGFRQGQDIYFGDTKATTTTYWADSAMTCLLPPYSQPGHVPVSVRASSGQVQSLPRPQATFLYKDDSQDELKHMALRVIAHKMTGKLDDASLKGFVNNVLHNADGMNSNSFNGGGGGPGGYNMNLENQLLKVLDLLDMDDSIYKAKLNMKKKTTGHTMLHLSVAIGYNWFTAGLLARGANPNVQDNGGYTPLHYAAMHDHSALVRRLIQNKADPTLRTLHGLLASDVATTREVIRAIKRAGRRGSSLHSRASSATSLRSFWEPPQPDVAYDGDSFYSDSSESDEVQISSSEEDLDWHGPYLDMTVRGRRRHGTISSKVSLVDLPNAEEQGGMASAAVAIAAFKEQIQLLQQTMLQNMAHIQTPKMMQDCQAYLNSAQQRVSAYIPTISSPFMPVTTLPPAYDEIFPGGGNGKRRLFEYGDMDTKQASALRAATDCEADEKCAVRYDQQQATAQAESSTTAELPVQEKQVQKQLPKLLQIGRKNNITKEQQDNLRQARAESQKSLMKDAKLFLFWIPLLLLICFSMFHHDFVAPFRSAWNLATSLGNNTRKVLVGTAFEM